MHARIRHHEVAMNLPVTHEARIVVMAGGAGPNAVITARAAIEIDQHRGRTVDEAVLDQKLHHVRAGVIDLSASVPGNDPRIVAA